jgi:hypothetical protein
VSGVPGDLVLLLGGGQLLVGRRAVLHLARALAAAERVTRQVDGICPSSEWAALRDAVGRAAAEVRASAAGSAEVRPARGLSGSEEDPPSVLVDPVGTADAAALLAITPRAVRERCRRGAYASAVQRGSAWLIERHEVEVEALSRSTS